MPVADLLANDRFAAAMGVRLVEGPAGQVVVEMALTPGHLDAEGNVSAAVLFSLADCAMSLISNSAHTAVAVATHLVNGPTVAEGEVARAEAAGRLGGDPRAKTWDARVLIDGIEVAAFTGTTLMVNDK